MDLSQPRVVRPWPDLRPGRGNPLLGLLRAGRRHPELRSRAPPSDRAPSRVTRWTARPPPFGPFRAEPVVLRKREAFGVWNRSESLGPAAMTDVSRPVRDEAWSDSGWISAGDEDD